MDFKNIKTASFDDTEDITTLVIDSYKKYESVIGKKPAPMLANYEVLIKNNKVWKLIINNKIVGIVVIEELKNNILLENIAVIPEYQGKGYGKLLLKFAESYGMKLKKNEINLYTNIKMESNIRFYKNNQYEIIKEIEEEGYNRIYLSKKLK